MLNKWAIYLFNIKGRMNEDRLLSFSQVVEEMKTNK